MPRRFMVIQWRCGGYEEVRVSGIDITAELDGANSASYFTGSIFDLLPGANDLIYTDSEGTRTVRITVVKSDLG